MKSKIGYVLKVNYLWKQLFESVLDYRFSKIQVNLFRIEVDSPDSDVKVSENKTAILWVNNEHCYFSSKLFPFVARYRQNYCHWLSDCLYLLSPLEKVSRNLSNLFLSLPFELYFVRQSLNGYLLITQKYAKKASSRDFMQIRKWVVFFLRSIVEFFRLRCNQNVTQSFSCFCVLCIT